MIGKDICQGISDEELVVKTLADQNFYYCLVERYEKSLKRYIKRITNLRDEEVEDVLQDIFLKAYLNLNDFNRKLKFSSWLYRLTHNEVIDNYRKRKARKLDNTVALDDWKELVDSFSHEEELDLKISTEQLREVLAKLDNRYREVLELKFLEEKDYNEISDILEKPLGTIASLINRAKKQFKKVVEEENIKF